MISASNLERIRECPKSARLPQVQSSSDDAQRGTAVHAYLANVISGREPLEGVAYEYHDVCLAIDLDRVPDVGSYIAEMAFAFNVDTQTARGLTATDRRYDIGANEVPGTCDAVGLTDQSVVIIDWKGRWSKATKASENLQLGFYALCAAKVFNKGSAIVSIARVGEDGPRFDVATLDAFDLCDIEEKVIETFKRSKTSETLREGEHCRYCPAFDSCPAKHALARSVTSGRLEAHVEVALDTMDDAARAEVWHKIKAGETLLERLKAKVRESIARKPIDCGDTMIVITEETRRSIDALGAMTLAPEVTSAVKMTLTITDAEKILGKNGIDRIADCIKTTLIEKVKEVKKSKLLEANK